MLRELDFKPDFGKTIDRFAAWWHRQIIDRPPVTLFVPPKTPPKGLPAAPASLRDRWMNVEYVVDRAVAGLEAGTFLGDTLPLFNPDLGPEITATLYGVEIEFGTDTSWSKPIIHDAADWETILARQPDFANVYWQTLEKIMDGAIASSRGRYLVGMTDLHGNFDILAALRDPQELCMDVIDCPDVLRRVDRHVAQGFVAAFQRQYARLAAAGMGSSCWTPFYHEGPSYVPSSDFWCMVSNDDARNLVLPDILVEIAPMQRSIFHLDGPRALRHLDLLLEIPQLNAVQWAFGAGQGPAAKWIDVYRRIIRAGKAIQVFAEGPDDALQVLDAVGPEGVWLCPGAFPSVEAGQNFLREVERRTVARGSGR
jgi:hypothetical protein